MGDVPSLRDRRQTLLDDPDLKGLAFCRAYAHEADVWLSAIAERAVAGGHPNHLALLAVGGYGRGELCPFSDFDVVLVHTGRGDVAKVADAIWYPVWDQGVHLDHSVRRPKEVLEAASGDLRVALGLLDARVIWGEHKVAEPIIGDAIDLWRAEGAEWLDTLAEQMHERHVNQGDVAFLLEPDLKESHGGLRDVNVLNAIAAGFPLLDDYVDLSSLQPAAELLTDVRVELHRRAGRALDRLLLQEQDHVASVLGFGSADELMAHVAEAGRSISWLTDDAWRRRHLWQPRVHRRSRSLFRARPKTPDTDSGGASEGDVEPGIAVVRGEVALTPSAAVTDDPSLPLRLAAVAAERDLPISTGALHRLADTMPPFPDPWPTEAREALVRVLLAGAPAIRACEALDQRGLMARVLPEWAHVRNRPQRNAYHRFTVDRHLLEAAANASELVGRVDRPDLLLVGALLHDIGKGYPGDHTEVGIALMRGIATRMGFPPGDVATLTQLVALHLLLPDTATRRDLDDPATIERVAEAVSDRGTLELLGALTEADSLATGPAAWGQWKAGLVRELVARTGAYLDGQPTSAGPSWLTEPHKLMMAEVRENGRPIVVLDPPRVAVAAPDRTGLLSAVAGILALHGLDVRSADVSGDEGVALEIFTVEVGPGSWPDSALLRADLEAVFDHRLELSERLAAKAQAYAGTRRPSSARPLAPRVRADVGASHTSTVIELRALDEVGLLHRVTRILFDLKLDVVSARVSTLGNEVVDAFYVRDAHGEKIDDPVLLDAVVASIAESIGA